MSTNTMVRRSTLDEAEFHENANGNGHALAPAATVEIAMSRAAQEVQAAMTVAKRFPRDENAAFTRIMKSCRRRGLAEAAIYEYPRGGEKVTGPSIRLAEALAQAWGNLDFGIVELEQRDGESQVMAFAWDLETNTRQTKVFTVPHERHTRNGVKDLTDPRDIYELVANQGARRLRACILGVIPGDIIDAAVRECHKTITNQSGGEPLSDRVRSMVVAFADQGVTQDMIEARLGHNLDATSEHELAGLRRVYTSIRDGMGSREQFFSKTKAATSGLDAAPDSVPSQTAGPAQAAPAAPQPPHAAAATEPGPSDPAPVAGPAEKDQVTNALNTPPAEDDPADLDRKLAAMKPEAFVALLREKAKDNGVVQKAAFEGGLWKFSQACGVGDVKSLDTGDRPRLYRAVVANKFDYAKGEILK